MDCCIAIVGATGLVGRTVIKILNENQMFSYNYLLFASEKSKGKKLKIGDKKIMVKTLSSCNFLSKKIDYALFCTDENISKKYIPLFTKNGTKVIDFSSYYRHKYPLIIPEINSNKIKGKIICNPNCSTIAGLMSLYKIHQMYGLKRIVYSTYQAVSGAGQKALDDMKTTNNKKLKKLDFVIKDNLIPYIGEIFSNGYSKEENKMIYETKKILGDKTINVTATCVRIPISVCHSESINFETKKRVSLKEIETLLNNSNGVCVFNTYKNYPMPINVRGKNFVAVGRIRKDFTNKNSFNIFVVSDNLRKGSAQNAVQILQCLLRSKK